MTPIIALALLRALAVNAIPITLFEESTPVREELIIKFSNTDEGTREFRRLRADYAVPFTWSGRAEGFSEETQLEFIDYGDIQYTFGRLSVQDVKAVQKLAGVDALFYNKVYQAEQLPPTSSWGLDRVDQRSLPLDGQYSLNVDVQNSNVEIIIIDTGVNTNHPDWLPGQAEFNADCSFIEGKCRYDSDPGDLSGHGTHVAGTTASPTYGVAKGAKVLSMRALDDYGSGSTVTIVSAIVEATKYARAHPHKRFVINMSLGIPQEDVLVETATANAVAAGIVVVVAAGNDGGDACLNTPARVPEAITVGATEISDTHAFFTSHGSCVDIFAPGMDIPSLNTNFANDGQPDAVSFSGTSMASPHVCGAAALVLANQPYLTPAEVADELTSTATENALAFPPSFMDSPNLLLYTLEFASPEWPQPSVPVPVPETNLCSLVNGTGHHLGPRGAYAYFDGYEPSACCDQCTSDWQCRTFTVFNNTCYLYNDLSGEDYISCAGCVRGVDSGDSPQSPAPTPSPLTTPPITGTLSCGDTIFGNNEYAGNYVGHASGDVIYELAVGPDVTFFALTTCHASGYTNFDTVLRFFADPLLEIQLGENDDKPEKTHALGCSQLLAEWPNGTYYAAVEGAVSYGDFAISMQCGDSIDFAELTCGEEVHTTTVDAPNNIMQPSGEVIWKLHVGAMDEGIYTFQVDADFEAAAYILDSTRSFPVAVGTWGACGGVGTGFEVESYLAEGDYFFMVEGPFVFEGPFSVVMTCPGDTLAPSTGVPVEYVFQASCGDSIEGTTCGAPNVAPSTCAGDVIVELTTPDDFTTVDFTANTCTGTDYDSRLILFADEDFQDVIAENDDACGFQSEISAVLTPNTTYYIAVTGWTCDEGNFRLDIACEDGAGTMPLTAAPTTTPGFVPGPAPVPAPYQGTCVNHCGGSDPEGFCWCDLVCTELGDCCPDYSDVCELIDYCELVQETLGATACSNYVDDEGSVGFILHNTDSIPGPSPTGSATMSPLELGLRQSKNDVWNSGSQSPRATTKERQLWSLKRKQTQVMSEARNVKSKDRLVHEHTNLRMHKRNRLQQDSPSPSLDYLHYKGLTFDENNNLGSFNAINFCTLALYGDYAAAIPQYPNQLSSYTTSAFFDGPEAEHWYGGCNTNSGCSSCTNNVLVTPNFDWEADFTSGNQCSLPGAGNNDEDHVAIELFCLFDSQPPPPAPVPATASPTLVSPTPMPEPVSSLCAGTCGSYYTGQCWCDGACANFGDCCADFEETCPHLVGLLECIDATHAAVQLRAVDRAAVAREHEL